MIALLGPVTVLQARAEVYMDELKATQTIFPGEVLAPATLELTRDDVAAIEKASGKVRTTSVKYWKSPSRDVVFIDQVLGKHEYITYAVGIRDGRVIGVEVLEYRESYGQAVRKPEWTHQFAGKTSADALKVGTDIKNIGGATLSSVHITEGVKRLVQTYDRIRSRI